MTGKSRKVAAALKARRIDVCAVQETKWAGAKAKDIGEGYKILYNGIARTRNGVGIIVSEKFRDAIFEVERYDDRLMKVVFVIESRKIHFFTAYAPQAGCSALEKEAFWDLLDSKTMLVPADELLFVAGDLNGHVGKHSDGHPCHGGFGYSAQNDDGNRILGRRTTVEGTRRKSTPSLREKRTEC